MADYISIGDRQYRVASNVMGVSLGYLEAYSGRPLPEHFTAADWAILLTLSIQWGEKMDGRDSDFTVDQFCLLTAEEGKKVMDDFQTIYVAQHPKAEAPKTERKKD